MSLNSVEITRVALSEEKNNKFDLKPVCKYGGPLDCCTEVVQGEKMLKKDI